MCHKEYFNSLHQLIKKKKKTHCTKTESSTSLRYCVNHIIPFPLKVLGEFQDYEYVYVMWSGETKGPTLKP